MSKELINTENAPAAVGPYSQGIKTGNLIFTSGQLPIDPKTGQFAGDSIEEQAKASLENVKAVLAEAGATTDNVIKTVVYLQDLKDFAVVNEIYAQYFEAPFPARSCFQVAALPLGALVEIEAVAAL